MDRNDFRAALARLCSKAGNNMHYVDIVSDLRSQAAQEARAGSEAVLDIVKQWEARQRWPIPNSPNEEPL